MAIAGFDASILAVGCGIGAALALAAWWVGRRAARRKVAPTPPKRTNKEVMRARKDRRREKRDRVEEKLQAELDRCQRRLLEHAAEARELVERDPERAARAVRAMMKKP